ncbi:MAG: Ig-like domain-containing protein, partial [Erysipelotrichaceae bacterium]|nr:Ig-like domain-containing protein [Erysipelotrichaceae bacterium]
HNFTLNKNLKELSVEEGETVYVGQFAIPEYYALYLNENAKESMISVEEMMDLYKNNEIGKGSHMGYWLSVDNTAPELELSYNEEEKTVSVKATDNQNLAYVALTDIDGRVVYEQFVPGTGEFEHTFDVSSVDAQAVVIFAGDYAANERAKLVKLAEGEIIREIRTPVYRLTDRLEPDHRYIISASNVPGKVPVLLSNGQNYYTGADIATVYQDGNDIFILQSEVTNEAILWEGLDNNGYVSFLNVADGGALGYQDIGIRYVCWANPGYADRFIYEDHKLMPYDTAEYGLGMQYQGSSFILDTAGDIYLYVEDELIRYETIDPDKASRIELNTYEATLILNVQEELQMSAVVEPNFIEDRTVTWTSADEAVATVDENGLIKAVGVGKTTITATSNQTPEVTAEVLINVTEAQPINAFIYGQVGDGEEYHFAEIDLRDMSLTYIGDAGTPFYGSGESGEYIYGNDTNDDFYRYVISQEGIALDEDYSTFRINSNYALLDGANMPHLTFNQDGVDYEINYDVIGFNRMNWLELFVGSGLVYFDLSSYEPFVALA